MRPSILLIDPQPRRRAALSSALADLAPVHQAPEGGMATLLFRRLRPQVVLASMAQAGSAGPHLLRHLRSSHPWSSGRTMGVYGSVKGHDADLDLTLRYRFHLDFYVPTYGDHEKLRAKVDEALLACETWVPTSRRAAAPDAPRARTWRSLLSLGRTS